MSALAITATVGKVKRETESELLRRTGCSIWEIDGKFYPVRNNGAGQVLDIGGRDRPKDGVSWFANATEEGVKYVASWSPTRKAALSRIRRAFDVGGGE